MSSNKDASRAPLLEKFYQQALADGHDHAAALELVYDSAFKTGISSGYLSALREAARTLEVIKERIAPTPSRIVLASQAQQQPRYVLMGEELGRAVAMLKTIAAQPAPKAMQDMMEICQGKK